MKKSIITLAAGLAVLTACSDSDVVISKMQPPTDVAVERLAANEVQLTWTDNATAESGYAIMLRRADEPASTLHQIAEVAADVTSYLITDELTEGYSYYIGVKAFNSKEQSRVISVLYNMEDFNLMGKSELTAINSGTNNINASYKVVNKSKVTEWGLCWSADGVPTVNDAKLAGPVLDNNDAAFQVIPNTLLDYGVEYQVRAYAVTSTGVNYSTVGKASMTNDYQAITLEWNKVSTTGLPSEIEVFSTTSKLNGRNFEAWYAIADVVTGDVEFRVSVPSSAQTIDDQAAAFNGDCYVMVNGGYFYNGNHTGLAVVNGKAEGAINAVRGSLLTSSPEYNEMYNVTRGIFGVDANDEAKVFWAGTNDKDNFYYTSPLATVVGENKYGPLTASVPVAASKWNPKFALSAGPLLLIDGKIPFDFTMTDNGEGYYLTNYEVIAYDIFGTNVAPDRTAAGVTADGKVILFVCDGRTTDSQGATLLELAQIMKGLGCVGAVNFDGGGSTGMMVGDKHINKAVIESNGTQSPYNRAVVSTMGFFKK